MTAKKWENFLIFSLLLFFSLHRFYNLGFKELQMWDESLYGVRAKAVYYFNEWLDQTKHAVGGLYSSSHPPLFIWLTAIFYKIFNISEFTTRFFSALFGSLTVILSQLMVKKFFDDINEKRFYAKPSFLVAPFLGSIYLFNFYSRQAQLDIPYIFLITLSIYFYLNYLTSKEFRYIFFSGVSFGLSLMVKIIVGFFVPIAIGLFLILMFSCKRIKFNEFISQIFILTLIGITIALPWHIYMLAKHGEDFINTFIKFHIVERLTEGVEENIPELGFFYILNQLIVQFPPSILVFFDFIDLVKNFKQADKRKLLLHSWFWSMFFITSLSKTKIPTYVLPLFVPAVTIAGVYFVKALKEKNIVSISALLISLLWSSSQNLRDAVKETIKFKFEFGSLSIAFLFLIAILISPLFVKLIFEKFETNSYHGRYKMIKFATGLTLLTGLFVILKTEFFINYGEYIDGAQKICDYVDRSKVDTVFYFYTKHSTEGMNPQLTFYSYRKLSGSIKWIEIPRSRYDILKNYRSSLNRTLIIIEKTKKDFEVTSKELELTRKFLFEIGFEELLNVKRYILLKWRDKFD